MIQKKSKLGSGKKSGVAKTATHVAILAAGKGTRMRSEQAKVLMDLGGRPMLFQVLDAVFEAEAGASIALVVGHMRSEVEAAVRNHAGYADALSEGRLHFIFQEQQRGTGDAARVLMSSNWGQALLSKKESLLILPGDQPLMTAALVRQMLSPLAKGEVIRKLTRIVEDPRGYGRIVRKGKNLQKIVEERDTNSVQKKIKEVATSIYLFDSVFLGAGLKKLSKHNAQGEFYLTDLIEQASRAKKRMSILLWEQSDDLRGVNDLWELAEADRILNQRRLRQHALQGVRFIDPLNTYVEAQVKIGEGCVIEPGVMLKGNTVVGEKSQIGRGCLIKDSSIGYQTQVKTGTVIESSVVGNEVKLGPYAHLRPDSRVGAQAKIGNFVELKKTVIGERSSIAHLSYLGDATVGKDCNIGCGFVTCNFDGRVINGRRKHPTLIEDEVFVGSDCQVIAPIRLARRSYVASGSTLTQDVSEEDLAIARSRQVNKAGYARKLRDEIYSDTDTDQDKTMTLGEPCAE